MDSANIRIDHSQLDGEGLGKNPTETANRADVAAKSPVLENQTHSDRHHEKRQKHPASKARIGQGQGAEETDQQESAD